MPGGGGWLKEEKKAQRGGDREDQDGKHGSW